MFLLILVYLALTIIRPQDYPELVDRFTFPLMPGLLAVALLVWLASPHKRLDAPQYPLLLAFLLTMMMSLVVSGWSGGALIQFSTFAPVLVAFVLFANAVTSLARVRTTMAVFTVCAAVLALHGVQQAGQGVGWTGIGLSQGTRIQYVGIFEDPNDLGLLFVMCVPMAAYLSAQGGLLGLRRLFWLGLMGLLLYGVVLTDSRGSLLALACVFGLYMWRRFGKFAAFVCGVGGLILMQAVPSRLQQLDAGESSAAGRVDAWYEGFQMFFAHPLFGVGAGAFDDYHFLTAHNSFVLVLAETGIIGFTIWLAFVGYGLLMPAAVLRHRPELPDAAAVAAWQQERGLAFTLLLAQAGFYFCAFFLSRSYVVLLYLLAALVLGYYSGARQRHPDLPVFRLGNDVWRWGLRSVVAIVILYLITRGLLGAA